LFIVFLVFLGEGGFSYWSFGAHFVFFCCFPCLCWGGGFSYWSFGAHFGFFCCFPCLGCFRTGVLEHFLDLLWFYLFFLCFASVIFLFLNLFSLFLFICVFFIFLNFVWGRGGFRTGVLEHFLDLFVVFVVFSFAIRQATELGGAAHATVTSSSGVALAMIQSLGQTHTEHDQTNHDK
jgi:hypothetical protein